jgi:aminoglycoside phosphotransferase (APT) family kinase protein/SAM-dependent methyltransferase
VPYRCEGGVFVMAPPFVAPRAQAMARETIAGRMHELASDAAAAGWRDAHQRFSGEVLTGGLRAPRASRLDRARAKVGGRTWEDTLQDLVDPTRAGWMFLLDVRPTTRVCFLGPTFGAAPLTLARSCARVLVLDGCSDRLQLARQQARAAGLRNLTVATVSDPTALPLADGSADLIVVPGIAEWFEAVGGEQSFAAEAGAKLLAEMRRILAPGGQAYVGADNGVGPIRLLDLSRARRAPRYSIRTLRRAAMAAGFARTTMFAPLPFRHKFHQVLDVDRTDRMNFCIDPYRTRGRLLRPLVKLWDRFNRGGRIERRVYPYLPGIGAVLDTDGAARPFAERIFAHVGAAAGMPAGVVQLSRYYVRPKGAVVLVGEATSGPAASANGAQGSHGLHGLHGLIVRLPLESKAAATCARQHDALECLAADQRIPQELRRLFPAPIARGQLDGQTYFAETGLRGELGRIYYSRSEKRFDQAIVNAAKVLRLLRRATEVPTRIDDAQFHRLCGGWLDELRGVVRDQSRGALDTIDAFLRDTLLGTTQPLGWHHGDYDFANVLYGPDDRVTGILDFEVFDPLGLPLLDLLVLVARRPIREQGFAFGTLFVKAILEGNLPPLEKQIVEKERQTLGIDDRLYRALALCCWLNHLQLRRDSWLVRSPSWLDDNLHTVLESVRRVL